MSMQADIRYRGHRFGERIEAVMTGVYCRKTEPDDLISVHSPLTCSSGAKFAMSPGYWRNRAWATYIIVQLHGDPSGKEQNVPFIRRSPEHEIY